MKHLHTGAILVVAGWVAYLHLRTNAYGKNLNRHRTVLDDHHTRLENAGSFMKSAHAYARQVEKELEAVRLNQNAHIDSHVQTANAKRKVPDPNLVYGPGRDHSLAR